MNAPDDKFEGILRDIQAKIDQHGFTFIGVFDPDGENPPFAYTVGLTARGLPELLMIGHLNPATMQGLLAQVSEQWIANGHATYGMIPDMVKFADGGDSAGLLVQSVDPTVAEAEYTTIVSVMYPDAQRRYAQVMWPDNNRRYPNDPEFDPEAGQPMLLMVQ